MFHFLHSDRDKVDLTNKHRSKIKVNSRFFLAFSFIIGFTSLGFAQNSEEEDLLKKPRGLYLGVRPGEQNFAPGKELEVSEDGVQRVVWVGFQSRRNRAQIFVQTDSPPLFEIAESNSKTVIVDFPNARLHTKNEGRELDVSYFPTVVRSIRTRQVSKNLVRMVIRLRTPSRYRKKTDSKFLHIIFDPPKEPIDVIAEKDKEIERRVKAGAVVEYQAPSPL